MLILLLVTRNTPAQMTARAPRATKITVPVPPVSGSTVPVELATPVVREWAAPGAEAAPSMVAEPFLSSTMVMSLISWL